MAARSSGLGAIPPAQVGKARRGGLNENYGREIMELHTLGVDGGYTQKDVTEVARCFTGWSLNRVAPEVPDPMYSAPLLPALALPVLSTSVPLTPALPAFDVCKSNAPLLVDTPNPLVIDTRPPVNDDEVPADNTMLPPEPLLPDPTKT